MNSFSYLNIEFIWNLIWHMARGRKSSFLPQISHSFKTIVLPFPVVLLNYPCSPSDFNYGTYDTQTLIYSSVYFWIVYPANLKRIGAFTPKSSY